MADGNGQGDRPRQLPRHVYLGLKAATRRLITAAGGTEHAVHVTRVQKTALSNYENPNCDTVFVPLDVIADLESDTGLPAVTAALAQLTGHVLLPTAARPERGRWARRLAKVGKETAEVFAAAGSALQDGTITPREAVKVRREVEQAVHALMGFIAELNAVAEEEE